MSNETYNIARLCPCCQKPLITNKEDNSIFVYCAYGPCKSLVANDGAQSDTEAEAYKALLNLINEDLDAETSKAAALQE